MTSIKVREKFTIIDVEWTVTALFVVVALLEWRGTSKEGAKFKKDWFCVSLLQLLPSLEWQAPAAGHHAGHLFSGNHYYSCVQICFSRLLSKLFERDCLLTRNMYFWIHDLMAYLRSTSWSPVSFLGLLLYLSISSNWSQARRYLLVTARRYAPWKH
jgi:hypothetical protein